MTDVSTGDIRFGVNLMPPLWAGESAKSGADLMAQRRRLLGRMAATGVDHVMVGDHVMFHGGVGNDGLTDAASVVTAVLGGGRVANEKVRFVPWGDPREPARPGAPRFGRCSCRGWRSGSWSS